jgi:nucleoside-diphosphate-sugar epimerase
MQQNSNVLVVGGSGFIGKRLMKWHPEWDNIDLKDGADFTKCMLDDHTVIVFLAAYLDQTSRDYAKNLQLYNSLVTINTRRINKPHIIFTSSAAVYGANQHVHHNELEPPQPGTIYGKSKLLGEQIIKDYFSKYTILRLANIYGDGDGKGVVDLFKQGRNTIYGDGSNIRDYIYVEQVVDAIETIVKDPDQFNGETFNISSGKGQTVNEAYDTFGKGGLPEYTAARSFDVDYSVLDNSKAIQAGLL